MKLGRAVAIALLAGATVTGAAQAAPDRFLSAAPTSVVGALRALAKVTAGLPRTVAAGSKGTLEDAIVRGAPNIPAVVREGEMPAARPNLRCPPEMALVAGRVCVDRYEATLLEVMEDGSRKLHSPYHAPTVGRVYVAQSVAGLAPQAYITGPQAETACRNAKKRLCQAVEWRVACGGSQGFAYPYGKKRVEGACNDRGAPAVSILHGDKAKRGFGHEALTDPRINQFPGSLAPTGSSYACVNDYGIWDMVGNLHEWTADPNGTFQGGYYLDTEQHGEGCAYRTTAHDFEYADYSIGFRCCAG
ncbi:MAG: SUMF1/EgtB/PvdO family nonheme iron enzyme [Polyangiaceae bacterium]